MYNLNPKVLPLIPLSCEQLSILPWDKVPPIPTIITLADKKMLPYQQRPFASNPGLHPLNDGSVRDIIEEGSAGLVVLRQDDLVHELHAPAGTQSSSFLAEKATLK